MFPALLRVTGSRVKTSRVESGRWNGCSVPLGPFLFDVLKVRDAAVPYGINTIQLKQRFQVPQFLTCHKSHGNASPSHSSRSSSPVRVGLRPIRVVIINHVADTTEVEPATRNVGGNQERDLVSAKTLEDRRPPRLFQTSVDIRDRFEFSFQLSYQLLTVMP